MECTLFRSCVKRNFCIFCSMNVSRTVWQSSDPPDFHNHLNIWWGCKRQPHENKSYGRGFASPKDPCQRKASAASAWDSGSLR